MGNECSCSCHGSRSCCLDYVCWEMKLSFPISLVGLRVWEESCGGPAYLASCSSWVLCQMPKEDSWNQRITVWLGLEGTLMLISFHLSTFCEHSTVHVWNGVYGWSGAETCTELACTSIARNTNSNPNFSMETLWLPLSWTAGQAVFLVLGTGE